MSDTDHIDDIAEAMHAVPDVVLGWSDARTAARALWESDDPALHAAMLANLQARGYVPTTTPEWAIRWPGGDLSPVPASQVTYWTTYPPVAPARLVTRRVSEWEPVAP